MLDQSNLVKNMAAAFGHLAPSFLENIKTSCKSQLKKEVQGSIEFNQKNNSKDAKDGVEIVKK